MVDSTTEHAQQKASSARSRSLRAWAIVLVGALVAGYAISGEYLYHAVIGLDASAFPAGEWVQRTLAPAAPNAVGGAVAALVSLLVISLTGGFLFVWLRRGAVSGEAATEEMSAPPPRARRAFLAGSAAGLGALVSGATGMLANSLFGVGKPGDGWLSVGQQVNSNEGVVKTHPKWEDAWRGARVQAYGRLGRTEWRVSDTVLGAGRLQGDQAWKIVKTAFERGVNYVDTAPDYSTAGSEIAVGRALREIPRDQIFLATKFCTPIGHLPEGTPVARYEEVVNESLARLGTDYVDLVHVHSCDETGRLMDPNVHEAFDRLKQAGKVRFLGVSTHTPRLVEVANRAIDSGRFDVMMLAYHHGIWPLLPSIIDRAHDEQDMGIVAMKTLKGAKHRNLEGFHDANSYAQAALKWVHENPKVSCAVISFFELQHVDEYLYASGGRLAQADREILRRYDQEIVGSYCAPHCGACLSSCPEGVPIHDVLRHRMYFEDYHAERDAMALYAKLPVNASACIGCSAPCLGSCPLGIAIPERTQGAHALLTLSA
ncbi:aldo/keto reductase [Myxococcota bacterium]|nr:aldo/keto reductase [Myxococcota bacterium]